MLESGARGPTRGTLLVALCVPLLLADGARAEEGGSTPPSSTLAAFEELYERVTAAPAGDEPSPSLASAEEIRFALKTDLIRSDAEIAVLKLEAARYSNARQAAALDGLVVAAAARERRLWLGIRQLERATGQAAATPVESPAENAVTAKRPGTIQIDFEAEDVTGDPDP